MEWITQLNPTILITAIVLNSAGLVYALWILRQQQKDTKELTGNHIKHSNEYILNNTKTMAELSKNIEVNTNFTKEAIELIRELKK